VPVNGKARSRSVSDEAYSVRLRLMCDAVASLDA